MRQGSLVFFAFMNLAASQQIWDIWQTTWDRTRTFTNVSPSSPINFVTPGAAAAADIQVNDGTVFQTIDGFGGSLTDSSALTLNNLKSKNAANYWSILGYAFDKTDGNGGAGFSYLRVPIGASDFSANVYSLDDTSGDTSFSRFNINNAPSYLFTVIQDILSINPDVKVHILPWSPPGWMKTTGTMNGGTIASQYVSAYPTYLLKAVQGFVNKGITIYAISIQNEPENSNPTYPTCTLTPAVEGQIATGLRTLFNNNGLTSVKIVGYEHNWDDAAGYPVTLMNDAGNAYAGVAFHCYSGSVSQQDSFHDAHTDKEIYFTECTGTIGSDYWQDIKWYMDNIFVGSLEHYARAALMFNIALDGSGNPKLPGTNSCATGCRPYFTVNSDGSYSVNQEFYAAAQASKAVVPKDAGGPWAQRIGVTVSGSQAVELRVGAFVTGRVSANDWLRYSLVILNWNDGGSSGWNPQSITATIEFRGMQATVTLPVGVTTLWWFAPKTSSKAEAKFFNAATANNFTPSSNNATNGTMANNADTITSLKNTTSIVKTTPLVFNSTTNSTHESSTARQINATSLFA